MGILFKPNSSLAGVKKLPIVDGKALNSDYVVRKTSPKPFL